MFFIYYKNYRFDQTRKDYEIIMLRQRFEIIDANQRKKANQVAA